MAKDSAKKAHRNNQSRLRLYLLISAGLNVLYFLWRVVLYRSTFTTWGQWLGWLTFLTSEGGTLWLLGKLLSPDLDGEGKVESCVDINQLTGVPSYVQDVLWITWFVQLTTCLISDKFWYVYLVVPGFAAYQFWVLVGQPYLSARNSEEVGAGSAAESPEERKRREKKERKEQRKEKLRAMFTRR
eukprot:TRINITY_DN25917_c0_g1_i1.p2 TRINITY_DN25917_c0_g1~~TRINITY_DN25917_c0_g1_i1.p2  ORF type:complete len:201 (-),score=55.45 TRINITY_DN25917_c0_g1_i1:112-666(-)